MDHGMGIGALSRRTGCNIETIRYYEKVALLPPPPRTQGGHRSYDGTHAERLIFIRRSRELGFSIDDIRALLALVDGGDYTCAEIKALTSAHLTEVRRKISDLHRLAATLAEMVAACDRGAVPDCPVIEALSRNGAGSRETER